MKKALKTQTGLSHVMSVLAEHEAACRALVSDVHAHLPPVPPTTAQTAPVTAPPNASPATTATTSAVSALASAFPALSTKVKLNSILKEKK